MNNSIHVWFFVALVLISCSCTAIEDTKGTQLKTRYKILKNVSYGSHKQQVIYISKVAGSLGLKNFTIVFIHGGAYWGSDKSAEERYIHLYLKNGYHVVNTNYRLKQGIPPATEDIKNALNFLNSNNATYQLTLDRVILTGFSAGAQMASNIGASQNNNDSPFKLDSHIKIAGVINFGGPVDGLDVVEKILVDHEEESKRAVGKALFPSFAGYTPQETISKYETITYFDDEDPPFFIWHGGKDDQIPASTFKAFVDLLNKDKQKNTVVFDPESGHSPTDEVLKADYHKIIEFLNRL